MNETRNWQSDSKHEKLNPRSPATHPPKCPECQSQRIWKDGLRYSKGRPLQRWICRDCGRRFSQNRSKNPSEPLKKRSCWSINTASAISFNRQVCELLTEGSKNLVRVESRIEKQAAGATKKPTKVGVKGKIIEYVWWMKKQGYAPSTIEGRAWFLKRLEMLGADIFDPDSIKEVIARQETWNENSKLLAVVAYASFAQMAGIRFEPPRYRPTQKFPFIPTEEEIDQLIAACGKVISTFLQLLKETGVRLGEAWMLHWTDIDMKNRNVRITPEKGSNPRILPISMKLIEMLNNLPKKSEKIFTCSSKRIMNTNFYMQRKRIAKKLSNPRLLKITFHTLRHWKATMEYHKTKDILYVMKTLGHKAIQSTLIYIDLERGIFNSPRNDEYTVRVAKTLDETCNLLEAGFEYVTNMDDAKIFRKRK